VFQYTSTFYRRCPPHRVSGVFFYRNNIPG
jgi:hypothetical protein